MKVLVLNSGSSSIKYRMFDAGRDLVLAGGLVERIGERGSRVVHDGPDGHTERKMPIETHAEGFLRIVEHLAEHGRPDAVGHRVVHGGERFHSPARITTEVREEIARLSPLAPLHNPANLVGIDAALQALPDVPQVAVFDTAFHQTIPPHAYRYAVPPDWYEGLGLRRYGFHGTSHRFVSHMAAQVLGTDPARLSLVVLHLGNGASAAAIKGGRSIDTSMGLTPLEGLVMGTRCGDLDPAAHGLVARRAGLDLEAIEAALNEDSGLKGLCGANDMREIEERAAGGDADAELAIDVFCYRARKYVGAYAAAMGSLDAVVFTAGIGQRSAQVRRRICAGLEVLGVVLDPDGNEDPGALPAAIHAPQSRVAVLVVPTNEELAIARETLACLSESGSAPIG